LLGFALLGFVWLCLALLGFKKKYLKKCGFYGSYYPKIDARPIVAFLVWAAYRSVWLLQGVTTDLIRYSSIGPLNC
jgi:hypothetical protein